MYHFIFTYHRVKHIRKTMKIPPALALPLLFGVNQSIAILLRHAYIHCDVILHDCAQNVSIDLDIFHVRFITITKQIITP